MNTPEVGPPVSDETFDALSDAEKRAHMAHAVHVIKPDVTLYGRYVDNCHRLQQSDAPGTHMVLSREQFESRPLEKQQELANGDRVRALQEANREKLVASMQ